MARRASARSEGLVTTRILPIIGTLSDRGVEFTAAGVVPRASHRATMQELYELCRPWANTGDVLDNVHATAIEAAARICDGRARSQFIDSMNPGAGLEASKCAHAIRRYATRASLAVRPELTTQETRDA